MRMSAQPVELRDEPQSDASTLAKLESGVLLYDLSCGNGWCHGNVDGDISGYILQTRLWGVYPEEIIGERIPSRWMQFW